MDIACHLKIRLFHLEFSKFLRKLLLNRLTFHWEWNNKGFWQFVDRDVIRFLSNSFFHLVCSSWNR
jgi:hypothetical protein